MLTTNQRDQRLKELYSNRRFYEFMHSEQWFVEEVRTTWNKWMFVNDNPGSVVPIEVEITIWEIDEGYLE